MLLFKLREHADSSEQPITESKKSHCSMSKVFDLKSDLVAFFSIQKPDATLFFVSVKTIQSSNKRVRSKKKPRKHFCFNCWNSDHCADRFEAFKSFWSGARATWWASTGPTTWLREGSGVGPRTRIWPKISRISKSWIGPRVFDRAPEIFRIPRNITGGPNRLKLCHSGTTAMVQHPLGWVR